MDRDQRRAQQLQLADRRVLRVGDLREQVREDRVGVEDDRWGKSPVRRCRDRRIPGLVPALSVVADALPGDPARIVHGQGLHRGAVCGLVGGRVPDLLAGFGGAPAGTAGGKVDLEPLESGTVLVLPVACTQAG